MTTATRERRKPRVEVELTRKQIVLPELQKLTRDDGLLLAEDVVMAAEPEEVHFTPTFNGMTPRLRRRIASTKPANSSQQW